MDAMRLFCGGEKGGCECALVLLLGVAIISAFPNLLTGDEISRLIHAKRITSDDAKRISEGRATPAEMAQYKVDLLKLNLNSQAAAPVSQQQQPRTEEPLVTTRVKTGESKGCEVNPCRNGGVCSMPGILNGEATMCTCKKGFYGEFCDYDAPECEVEPCLHNGECQRSTINTRGYLCLCTSGYMGDNCEVTLNTESSSVMNPPVVAELLSMSIFMRPVTIVAFLCIIVFLLGMAFVATVEADRKVLTERYCVLISVGYRVDYPRIEFSQLAAARLRIICCCMCNMMPCCTCYQDDSGELPLPPNMRGVDPCLQLMSIVQAASLRQTPSQHSQQSFYERGSVPVSDAGIRGNP